MSIFKDIRKKKLIDLAHAMSVFDLAVIVLLLIAVPTATSIFAKGKPAGSGGGSPSSNVFINEINPDSGPVGTRVTISGSGFSDDNSIKVKGKTILSNISSTDGTSLEFSIPTDIACRQNTGCPIKIVVANQNGESNAYPFTLTNGPLVTGVLITTETLPDGSEKIYYQTQLTAEGGNIPYEWSITQGLLPSGLSLDSATGIISGVPLSQQSNVFRVQVIDANGLSYEKDFQLTIKEVISPITDITIKGRLVDRFTNEPLVNVNFLNSYAQINDVVQPTNENGEFSITADVTDLAPLGSAGVSIKSFWYRPSCYYTQAVSVSRDVDSSLDVQVATFGLGNANPVIYPVSNESVDVGDVTVWPATGIALYYDREMKARLIYPDEGSSVGNVNFLPNTEGHFGGDIVPFNYPDFTIELTDRDGNVFTDKHNLDRSFGCNQLRVDFAGGVFSYSDQ